MSIKFSGTFSQPGGAVAAIAKQIKALNFRAVKKVTVKFDPFSEKAIPTRQVNIRRKIAHAHCHLRIFHCEIFLKIQNYFKILV